MENKLAYAEYGNYLTKKAIFKVRRPTEKELQKYADDIKPYMLFGEVQKEITESSGIIKKIKASGRDEYVFPQESRVFLISREEADAIIREEEHQKKQREREEVREKAEKEKEIQSQRAKALAEARRTGKKVIVRKIGSYDSDPSAAETGIINVYEVATPDGEIIEEETPTY